MSEPRLILPPLVPGESATGLPTMWRRRVANHLSEMKGAGLIRPIILVFCSLVIWFLLFGLSYLGFMFLKEQRLPLGGGIVGLLFDLLFLSLGALLALSSGMILYGGLFTSPETAFLLSKPLRDDHVFAYRFFEAMSFSSWAFVVLGSPILIAFGVISHSSWFFFLTLPLFFIGYILIPGAIGAMACLILSSLLPRGKKALLILFAIVLVFTMLFSLGRFFGSVRKDGLDREFVDATLRQFQFSRWPALPSYWISRGIRAAGNGDTAKAGYNLGLIWANGLVLYLAAAFLASKTYRSSYDRVAAFGGIRSRGGKPFFLDPFLEKGLGFLGQVRRALIMKDFRAFRREPRQWAQIVVFGFLLFLYFGSVRRAFRGEVTWPFQNGVSFLNLFAVSLLQCTYIGRFVFPMLSLEGRNFWILGLVPVPRRSILWGKFQFAFWTTAPVAIFLVLLSNWFLKMPVDYWLIQSWTVLMTSMAMCGLGVGVGACIPNFKERDPSKIAAGFGGTLNLLISLCLLVILVFMLAGPWHLIHAGEARLFLSFWAIAGVFASICLGTILGIMATLIPMATGVQCLDKQEF